MSNLSKPVKIGLVANVGKPLAQQTIRSIAICAASRGIELVSDPVTASHACMNWPWATRKPSEMTDLLAIIVLGGDGTLLRAIHWLSGVDVPVLGLNIGTLGYLTSVREDQISEAFDAIIAKKIEITNRALLSAQITHADGSVNSLPGNALNEIVISRGSARMVRLAMELDGTPVTTYACDGLIISTPTGSTAYSLSAGGPLVMHGTNATIITVICPHALGSRPLIISNQTRITLRPVNPEVPLIVASDGEDSAHLSSSDTIEIFHSPHTAKIAFMPGHNPYQVLCRKFGWSGTPTP